jgi:serine protease Do
MLIRKIMCLVLIAILFGLGLGLGLGIAGLSDNKPLSGLGGPGLVDIMDPSPRSWARPELQVSGTGSRRNSSRHTVIVDIAQQVSPAVVSIGVTRTTIKRLYDPFGGDFFFAPYSLRQVRENLPYLGSGFIIDGEGHIVTNSHVVEDAVEINVTLTDHRTFQATLLDKDKFVDIALLKIEGFDKEDVLPTVSLGDSDDIMIGETVLAIGNPFGPMLADPQPSVSVGVVSAVNRSFRIGTGQNQRIYEDAIQTDAAINPGNSGGPLINLDGEVIGINTFIFSRSGDSASVGFSTPINRAARIVEEIIKYGELRMLRVDFKMVSLTPYLINHYELAVRSGAMVYEVDRDGPAYEAGLRPRDVVVEAEGKAVHRKEDVENQLRARTIGESLKITIIRDGQRKKLNYTIRGVHRETGH